jgi:hypothetical protein
MNSIGWVQEAMGQALEAVACRDPQLLRKIALPHWYGRYTHSTHEGNSTASCRTAFSMQEIGTDIHHLLAEVHRSGEQEINEIQEVKVLEYVWKRQFEKPDQMLNDCGSCIHRERSNWSGRYQ